MKIIFMGNPEFSAVVLEKLNASFPVSLVVTSPDKPVGRKQIMTSPALKVKADELGIEVLQSAKICRDGIERIKSENPDLVITAAFGQILTEEFLAVPKYGVLNVHASLLPKYRGAAPIQQAILEGESETGVTIMRTVKALDAGDILLSKKTSIGENDTAGDMFERLAIIGGEATVEAVKAIEDGSAVFTPQNEDLATFSKMITKSSGEMDFNKTCFELSCLVRAMYPAPSAFTKIDGKVLKVFRLEKCDYNLEQSECEHAECGGVVFADKSHGLCVKAADGIIRLCDVQLEGSRQMRDIEFLNGRAVPVGTRLGK